jgi:hypothetical protein
MSASMLSLRLNQPLLMASATQPRLQNSNTSLRNQESDNMRKSNAADVHSTRMLFNKDRHWFVRRLGQVLPSGCARQGTSPVCCRVKCHMLVHA